MRVVNQLEAPVVRAFKNFPSMPEDAKETFAKAWPYLALIFAIFQILGAYSAWRVVQFVDQFNYYQSFSTSDRITIYLGVIIMLVDAAVLFLAFSPLQKRAKRGWDLLLLGNFINIAYAVVALLMVGYGMGSSLMSLLATVIGLYLLVQVREKFTSKVMPIERTRVAPPKREALEKKA